MSWNFGGIHRVLQTPKHAAFRSWYFWHGSLPALAAPHNGTIPQWDTNQEHATVELVYSYRNLPLQVPATTRIALLLPYSPTDEALSRSESGESAPSGEEVPTSAMPPL